MKAVLCKNWGTPQDLVIENIPEPQISGDNQVLIEVKAVGLNFPDVLLIAGKYQAKPPFPFIPGGELAGIVRAVGKEVKHLNVGDHVAAFCGTGALAEQIVLEQERVVKIPQAMPWAEAAAFCVVYGTSYLALKHRANLQPKEVLLVHGAAGGVGLASVQIGKAMGATVIGTASTPEKITILQQNKIDLAINYQQENFAEVVKNFTQGKGANVILDPVGGDVADLSMKCIAFEGRLLVVGFTGGRIQQIPANLFLLKNAAQVGVFWSDYAKRKPALLQQLLSELLQMYQEQKIKPFISQIFDFENFATALQTIADRKAIGKIVVKLKE
ncbi:MAG: NADPH:quinone oxidoreductase family protein [Microscillaceae bacterium]|nr:NADPH:quinone oxidoreductase family protein [Microscillaceae bacterium]MDW8460776.1 NADPH:quinone oxidoreductase family protein [Cytophagales bacterium]